MIWFHFIYHHSCGVSCFLFVFFCQYVRWPSHFISKGMHQQTLKEWQLLINEGGGDETLPSDVGKMNYTDIRILFRFKRHAHALLAFILEARPADIRNLSPSIWLDSLNGAFYSDSARSFLQVLSEILPVFSWEKKEKTTASNDLETCFCKPLRENPLLMLLNSCIDSVSVSSLNDFLSNLKPTESLLNKLTCTGVEAEIRALMSSTSHLHRCGGSSSVKTPCSSNMEQSVHSSNEC